MTAEKILVSIGTDQGIEARLIIGIEMEGTGKGQDPDPEKGAGQKEMNVVEGKTDAMETEVGR